MSLAIFISEPATVFSAPLASTANTDSRQSVQPIEVAERGAVVTHNVTRWVHTRWCSGYTQRGAVVTHNVAQWVYTT